MQRPEWSDKRSRQAQINRNWQISRLVVLAILFFYIDYHVIEAHRDHIEFSQQGYKQTVCMLHCKI